MSKTVTITTGLIESYQKGISLSLGSLSDAVEEILAQMDIDGSEETSFTVKIVRNKSVYTDEQLDSFKKDRQSRS